MTFDFMLTALVALLLFAVACWVAGAYNRLRVLRRAAESAHAAWQHMLARQRAAGKEQAPDDALLTLASHYVVQAHGWNVAAHQWPAAMVAQIMRWPDMEEACRETGQPKMLPGVAEAAAGPSPAVHTPAAVDRESA